MADTQSAPDHAFAQIDVNLQASAMNYNRLLQILKTTEITFIPVLNHAGRMKVESGDSCTNQRKNGRNVDVNRNFANWFDPNNAKSYDEDYQGPSSMSEWEANIVRTLAQQFHPHAFIDIHSGDLGMGYVYGHSASARTADDELNSKWARAVDSEAFGGSVWVGNLANMGSMPYQSHGCSCDYMYETQKARISGTWEIWRKPSFFAQASTAMSQNSASLTNVATMTAAASKFDYVSTTVTPIDAVDSLQAKFVPDTFAKTASSSALQIDEATLMPAHEHTPLKEELLALVQSAVDETGHNENLGLNREQIQSLVQLMQEQGNTKDEIQTLLQDMSREQCFAYFNPVMPEDYDRTVSMFTLAILVGAEKLSSPEISAAFH